MDKQRLSRDSLESLIWRFRGSSLQVVTEQGMKVHLLVETLAALRGGRERKGTHSETSLWARPALGTSQFRYSSKQPWEERESHLHFTEEQC